MLVMDLIIKQLKYYLEFKEIEEFNIGHFIIGESIFFGLSKVIKNLKKLLNNRNENIRNWC